MFYVGQHVVCVDDQWRGTHHGRWYLPCPLKVGDVYEVRGISRSRGTYYESTGHEVLLLDGVINPYGDETGFAVFRFRPLQDSRLDIFRQLLVTPPKQGVDA